MNESIELRPSVLWFAQLEESYSPGRMPPRLPMLPPGETG